MYSIKQKGMTLIELTVVLLILVALAGLALPYVSGTSRKALCDATDVSMMNIKQVIMQRYYLDTLGNFPQDLEGLSSNTDSELYNLHFLFSQSSLGVDGIPHNTDDRGHKVFDPDSAIGWHGAYLQNGQELKANMTTGNFNNSSYTAPLKKDHSVVIDSWGRPFILQVVTKSNCLSNWGITTTDAHCARLVSAGPESGLGLENGSIDTAIAGLKSGDDRVLYLNVPTPASDINESCSD